MSIAIFNRPAFGTTLLVAFVDHFGIGPLAGDEDQRWDPGTLSLEIAQDAGGLLPENFDKLMALVEVITTDHFQNSVSDFARICNTLADSPTDGTFDPLEPHEAAWGYLEAMISGGLADDVQFAPEIRGYVQKIVMDAGIRPMPELLLRVAPEGVPTTGDFTDDPGMFEAVSGVAEGHESELDAWVGERFQQLLVQLGELELKNARSKAWRADLLRELMKVLDAGTPTQS